MDEILLEIEILSSQIDRQMARGCQQDEQSIGNPISMIAAEFDKITIDQNFKRIHLCYVKRRKELFST